MSRMKRSLTLIFFVIASIGAQGQHGLDTVKRRFERYRSQTIQEKLYVHLDRDFYVTGETIWFKIYVVDGALHRPLDLSKVAYVEIIGSDNSKALHGKIELKNGKGSGSFFVPASISSGSYQVRAYTRWMDNFDQTFFYQQKISIVNPFVQPAQTIQSARLPALIPTFYPEGGHLVAGIKSRVAFRFLNELGQPVKGSGSLVNSRGDTIARFASSDRGFGSFSFQPGEDGPYRAIVRAGKISSAVSMPDVKTSGIVMNLTDSAQFVRVSVTCNDPRERRSNLIIHTRQVVNHAETKGYSNGRAEFLVDKKFLGDGISHFTIFNDELAPVCERLFFTHPRQKLDLTIKTNQEQYGVRRKVGIELGSAIAGRSTMSNVSVSIFKIDSLTSTKITGLHEFLILTSELNGQIENPDFYLSDTPEARAVVDELMLTQGWRRFRWADVMQSKPVLKFIPEFRGPILTGTVVDLDGKPVRGVTTFVSSPDKVVSVYPSISDNQGKVIFETPAMYGKRRLIVQSPADSVIDIKIDEVFSTQPFKFNFSAPVLSPSLENSLLERSVGMQVQDVYHEDKLNSFATPTLDSIPFYGKADETFYLDNYTRFPVMEEVMREYVPGVLVRKRRDGFNFLVLDDVHKTAMRETPLILLDGVPLFDADEIMLFDPRKIRKLEVLRRPYNHGPVVFSGIVSYSTYEGDMAGFTMDPTRLVLDFDALQLQREFYAPRYESERERGTRLPDQRNLLLWKPDIDISGEQPFSFDVFTSDLEGNYMIRVEGLTSEGAAGSAERIFSVKRFDN